MIDVASQAPNSIKILNHKVTCNEVISMFKTQMKHLQAQLKVRLIFFIWLR